MGSPARHFLLPGFLTVVTPSPTPSAGPIDSATLGEQQIAYFEQFGTSIKLAVLHAFVFTLHALLLAAEVAVAAGLVVLIGRIATSHVRRAINRRPMTGFRVLPPTDARFQPEAWLACFRALYSLANSMVEELADRPAGSCDRVSRRRRPRQHALLVSGRPRAHGEQCAHSGDTGRRAAR